MRSTAFALIFSAVLATAACNDALDRPELDDDTYAVATEHSRSDLSYEAEAVADEIAVEPPRTAEPQAPPSSPATIAPPLERKLIRTGTVAFATSNLDSAHRHITGIAAALDAYVSAERESEYGGARHLNLTLRVPAGRFAELLTRIGDGVTDFDERIVDTRDVTAEHVDLAARLRARRVLEDRYVTILARADDVEDLLAVEHQLARIREEIEAAEGQLRYLENRSALSTLEVHAYEPLPESLGDARPHPVVASLSTGWTLLTGLALGLLSIWPFALIAVAAFLVLRKRGKRSRPA